MIVPKGLKVGPAWLGGAALWAGVLLSATFADATAVRGKVVGYLGLVNPILAESRDPKNRGYSFREAVPTVPADYRTPYPYLPRELCLAAFAPTAQTAPQTPFAIKVAGGRTTPVTIVVAPGTKLEFQNRDQFPHSLYIAGESTFQPSPLGPNNNRLWTVPKEGTFEVRDELAPSVRMWIVADAKTAGISFPSRKGAFSLELPEGDFEVQAFLAGKPVGPRQTVSVTNREVQLPPLNLAPAAKEN